MLARQDWMLLALAAAGPEGLSPVQIQKSLFLLGKAFPKETGGSSFYRFKPYNYGPFCVDVYTDAERLSEEGLVAISARGGTWSRRYSLTGNGEGRVRSINESGMPAKPVEYLGRVVEWAQKLSFEQLVRAIYDKFPDQRANSVFGA